MNKNNQQDLQGSQPTQKSKKKKVRQLKSQFTRSKLENDYQPKAKIFKHKILRSQDEERNIFQRIQLQKQQDKIVRKAMECFRKGEIITIDWRTRSNFRKSQNNIELPRINTQPIPIKYSDHQRSRSDRSNLFNNILQNRSVKSVKNRSIEEKHEKLTQLLCRARTIRKNTFGGQQHLESRERITQIYHHNNKPEQSVRLSKLGHINKFEGVNINSQFGGRSETFLSRENTNQEEELQLNFQKLRTCTNDIQSLRIGDVSNSKSEENRQIGQNQQTKSENQKQLDIDGQKINLTKQNQTYDILNDPTIYFLISKSRERIISFKQKISISNMSQLQRFKYLQAKKSYNAEQQNVQKTRALNKSAILSKGKTNKEKLVDRINERKQQSFSKLAKYSRVLTQTQVYLKNNSSVKSQDHPKKTSCLQDTQNIVDENAERKWEQSQSKIKRRKRQTIVEAQDRLLKNINLSFLKQDLTKKFQEIRNFQKSQKSDI